MIRQIYEGEYNIVDRFLLKDIARNYFLLLGLRKGGVYKAIFEEFEDDGLKAALLLRKSGVLQFYAREEFNLQGFVEIIRGLDYKSLIGPKTFCHGFLNKGVFSNFIQGAYLSKLDKQSKIIYKEDGYKIRHISINDLENIVELYKNNFESFAPLKVMEEKLILKRGRGVCIEINGQIVSVAQTDFETGSAAVIVGVATDKRYERQGLATRLMEYLCQELQEEGKDIYLQYDNLNAESLYSSLGFQKIDRIVHYFK